MEPHPGLSGDISARATHDLRKTIIELDEATRRQTKWMIGLTWSLVAMTAVLVALTVVLLVKA